MRRQLFFGAYTITATLGAIISVTVGEMYIGLSMFACAGVGALALTKGERY